MDGADPERFRCDEFGELAALRSGKGEVQAVCDTALEHIKMFGQRDDRLHHVQIMDSCGIDLRQCRREKVRLLLIVAFDRHAVAGLDDRFQQLRRAFRWTELSAYAANRGGSRQARGAIVPGRV